MTSRDTILSRIRAAVAGVPDVEIPRDYHGPTFPKGPADASLIEHFAERVRDYRATVHIVPADEVPAAIQAALSARQADRVIVPEGAPAEGPPGTAGESLTPAQLDEMDGVVTGCAVAVAETGTIVLDGGPGMGRRALTLVPDYHLCVVKAEQIVPGVPDAIARLDPVRPLTWISGPSATSDIELNRVEGVHGPRTLEVIIAT